MTITRDASGQSNVVFVDASRPAGGDGRSWATAFADLQDGLALVASAPALTEVWVARGTYRPDRGTRNREMSFGLVDARMLLGGFAGTETVREQRDPQANPTILSGDLDRDDGPGFVNYEDNSRHVVRGVGIGPATVLDGFTVYGGNADFPSAALTGGGGLFVQGSVRVSDCEFRASSAGLDMPTIGGFGGGALVEGGSSTFDGCAFTDNRGDNGGALGLFNAAIVVIRSCRFANNASRFGTGGALWSLVEDLRVERCVFEDNLAQYGGAIIDQNSTHTLLVDSRFERNHARVLGGAFRHSQTFGPDTEPAVLLRCTFVDNSAADHGGAVIADLVDLLVVNCRFFGNRADTGGRLSGGGGAIANKPVIGLPGALDVQNSLFSGNSAAFGGGIFTASGSKILRLVQTTFASNSATVLGGGVLANQTARIDNSILWHNRVGSSQSEQAQVFIFRSATMNFSNVQGLTGAIPGEGNIGEDPLFIGREGPDGVPGTEDDDLHVAAGSPAINAGDNAALPADVLDLDGDGNTTEPLPFDLDAHARDDGGGVDMGAFEFALRWTDLGNALPGTFGPPLLEGFGNLFSRSAFELRVSSFLTGAPGAMVFGLRQTPTPLLGGVVVPSPDVVIPIALPSDPMSIRGKLPVVSPGIGLHFQLWFVDPGGVFGAAATNAIVGVTL